MNLHNEIMNIPVDEKELQSRFYEEKWEIVAYKFGHRDARHAAAELSLKVEARIEELEKKLRREEEEHGNTVNQRDQAEAYAHMLSVAIGEHFRVDVGEHNNGNCPWFEAEKVMNGEYITDSDEEREIHRLRNENEKYNQRYLNDLDLFGKCQEKENYQQKRIEELEFLLKKSLGWLEHYEDCHGRPQEIDILVDDIKSIVK